MSATPLPPAQALLAILAVLTALPTPFVPVVPTAQASDPPRVLLPNSYHQDEDWSDNELAGSCPSCTRPLPTWSPRLSPSTPSASPARPNCFNLRRCLSGKIL